MFRTAKITLPTGLLGALNITVSVSLLGAFSDGWLEVEGPRPLYSPEKFVGNGGDEGYAFIPSEFLGWACEVVGLTQGSGFQVEW